MSSTLEKHDPASSNSSVPDVDTKSPIAAGRQTEAGQVDARRDDVEVELLGRKLGTAQLILNDQTILIPTPSDDPNDPLRWSRLFKGYVTGLACAGAFMSNMLASSPSVAIQVLAKEFTGIPPDIQKTSYFFSTVALFLGVSTLFWNPFIVKYGTRWASIFGTLGYMGCAIWAGKATSYPSHLGGRIMMAIFAGAAESYSPLMITNITFLHHRGRYMNWYTGWLAMGTAAGTLLAGVILLGQTWRYIYYINAALVGGLLLAYTFTVPETTFRREAPIIVKSVEGDGAHGSHGFSDVKKTWRQNLALFNGAYTREGLIRMFLRPWGMIVLPAVAWASLVWGVAIGFMVATTTTIARALGQIHHFTPSQVAWTYSSSLVSGLLALLITGYSMDWLGLRKAKRNGGVFEPEFRILAILPAAFFMPFGLLLYGASYDHRLHWMASVMALAMQKYANACATAVSINYAIDTYKPVAGEVIVCIMAAKSIIAFSLGFGTNEWVQLDGWLAAFGEMSAIAVVVFLFVFLFYLKGKQIREASVTWRLTRWIGWDSDRDDVAVVATH